MAIADARSNLDSWAEAAAAPADAAHEVTTTQADASALHDVLLGLDATVPPDAEPAADAGTLPDLPAQPDAVVTVDVAKADAQPDVGPPAKAECACFVQQAWCGSGVAKEAAKLACAVPLLPAHADDILGCSGSKWIVKENCALGCVEAPKGTADTCKAPPAPVCQLKPGKVGAQLTWGLHPDASNALRALGVTASGISQTIGNAPASAGYHEQDGASKGLAYCAATDLKVGGMSQGEIKALLQDLAEVGFAAWYRKPGYDGWPSNGAPHIHAVWQGAKMKVQLRSQVHSFMAGKNGLTSNTVYQFTTWSACWKSALWKLFVQFNPASG